MVGFLAGRNADQWFSRKKDERKAAVVSQLEAYFGKEAKKPKDYVEKNWSDDDNVCGGPVCHVIPGGMHNFHALRRPHGRVHFAGTEVATKWTGYMDGAVQAGHWAAASVAKEIDAGKLTEEDKDILKEFKTSRKDYGKLQRSKQSSSFCSII